MSELRRWLDGEDSSIEAALLGSARADRAPAGAKERAAARLGLAVPGENGRRAKPAMLAKTRPQAPSAHSTIFESVIGARTARGERFGLGRAGATAVALVAAIAAAFLLAMPPSRMEHSEVAVDLAAPAATSGPVRIAGRDPVYTPEALSLRVEGTARVRCTITPKGTLTGCEVLQSVPYMDNAVLEALATWRFQPITHQGRPMSIDYVFEVRIQLPA